MKDAFAAQTEDGDVIDGDGEDGDELESGGDGGCGGSVVRLV